MWAILVTPKKPNPIPVTNRVKPVISDYLKEVKNRQDKAQLSENGKGTFRPPLKHEQMLHFYHTYIVARSYVWN